MTSSIKVYHGTSAAFEGFPSARTTVYGLTGVYLTESIEDAWAFAGARFCGYDDEKPRVFEAMLSVEDGDVLDLSEVEFDDESELHDAASESGASVVIFPDMSGITEREILVKRPSMLNWERVITE